MAKEMQLVQMLVFSLFNMKEKIEEMEMDSFYRFVHKGQHSSPDCWRREIQACFQRMAEDFLDAKVLNIFH